MPQGRFCVLVTGLYCRSQQTSGSTVNSNYHWEEAYAVSEGSVQARSPLSRINCSHGLWGNSVESGTLPLTNEREALKGTLAKEELEKGSWETGEAVTTAERGESRRSPAHARAPNSSMSPLLFLTFLLLVCPSAMNRVRAVQQEGPRGWAQTPDGARPARALPDTEKDSETNKQTVFRHRVSLTNASQLKKTTDEDSETGSEVQTGRKSDHSGIIKKVTLSGSAPHEEHPLNSGHEPSSDQHSAVHKIPSATVEGEAAHTSLKNALRTENKWLVPIVLHLNYFDGLIISVFSTLISVGKKAVAALPENMRPGPDLYGCPWEAVICGAVLVLILICQIYRSVTSRFSVAREEQLVREIVELIEEKNQLLEEFSFRKKEYEELEDSLKNTISLLNLKALSIILDLKTETEKLMSSNSALENKREHLEKELEEEKVKGLEQDNLLSEIQKGKESLEEEIFSDNLQIAEAKTILKIYKMNKERLEKSVQDATEENSQLRESEKQLLQEVEGWKERVGKLSEQAKMLEASTVDMKEVLKSKECQAKSLKERLLKMVDWSWVTEAQDAAERHHFNNDGNAGMEDAEHLDDQKEQIVRKLILAAQLNTDLKSLETERNQIEAKLTEEKKAKEQLAEHIESLEKENVVIESENAHLENKVQNLQQKLNVMKELYQDMGMNLHRKLIIEEQEHLPIDVKLLKADENISHAAAELNTYRQLVKDVEEELKRTVRFYQSQLMVDEKKAHNNWLRAWSMERSLNTVKVKNSRIRQRLLEAELKYELLKTDHDALDAPAEKFIRGQLYNKQSLPLQKPERVYSSPPSSGWLLGPADFRSCSMCSFDIEGGQVSENNSGMDWSENEMEDQVDGSEIV